MNYLYSNQYYPMGMYPQLLGQAMAQPGMPYFPAAGYTDIFAEEKQVFEDARRLQAFYPRIAQEIQRYVEEECDKLEYEGSMMFDEYPDRIMLMRLAEKITDKMKDFSVEDALLNPEPVEEMAGQSPDRRRPGREHNWLGDFVQVMLLDEMHRRRCRHRRCRNRRFW